MVYEDLYKDLQKLNPDLYWELIKKGTDYTTEIGRLESALATHSPEIKIRENVEGKYNDLEKTINKVNERLKSHQPPLSILPTRKRELTVLVFELVGKVHMERRR